MSRSRPSPSRNHDALLPGRVVATHGRHCLVESPDGSRLLCHARGKRNEVVVGDQVRWARTGDEGIVEKVDERRNLFYRQDEWRTKSFAANIDLVLVLLAADPEFSESQLTRALIASEAAGIPAVIALNKLDVQPGFDRAWQRLAPYRRMGYAVLPLCLRPSPTGTDIDASLETEADSSLSALTELLAGRSTLVLGPGGGQEHAGESAGAACAGRDRRNFPRPQLRQAHHHQHHLVLDR